MLTKEQVLRAINRGKKSECMDSRDFYRLADYFEVLEWDKFGVGLKEGVETPEPKAWTEEEILSRLKSDVEFGFEKAIDKRGISASFMNEVVKMWLWILEDDLQHCNEYAQYGLPLLKKVAVKYNFDSPIGNGDEDEYSV